MIVATGLSVEWDDNRIMLENDMAIVIIALQFQESMKMDGDREARTMAAMARLQSGMWSSVVVKRTQCAESNGLH